MRLVIVGRIPSKKNSRNIFVRGGRLFNIPSKKYKEWHKEASTQVDDRLGVDHDCVEDIARIELDFYAPDKRITDLTNKAESILDLLVDNNVILDDNWFILGTVYLSLKGIDREAPRCEITIHRKRKRNVKA